MSNYRTVVLSFLILAALPALYFITPWAIGQVYGTFDLANITIPLEQLYARYQSAGQIPVWVPEIQAGFPMMANGFQSYFYLPHVILRALLPAVWAVNVSLLLHLWLAALGMWLMLRQHKLSYVSAAIGSLLFSAAGYFIGHITLPFLIFAAAYVPWIGWGLIRFWHKPSWQSSALLGAVLATQIFAGHVQIFLYSAALLVIVALVLYLRNPKQLRPKKIILLLSIPILVFLLTAIHILPIRELLPLSKRSLPLSGEEAFDVSYPPWQALSWVFPAAFGSGKDYFGAKNEPELYLYFGVVGSLLIISAFLSRRTYREQLGQIALLTLLVGAALAGGEFSPAYRAIHHTPTFLASVANPGRAIILIHFALSVLAAIGVSHLLKLAPYQRLRKFCYSLMIIIALILLSLGKLPEQILVPTAANIQQHLPLLSLLIVVALTVIIRPTTSRTMTVLVMVIALDLLPAGLSINQTVSAEAYKNPSRIGNLIPLQKDSPRVYSQINLSPKSPPNISPQVGPFIHNKAVIQQNFTVSRNTIDGIYVRLTWDGIPPVEGTVKITISDADSRELRVAQVSGKKITDDNPLHFSFEPLFDISNKPLILNLSTTYQGKYAPKAIINTNLEGDFEPTGEVVLCRGGKCDQILVGKNGQSTDLAFEPIFQDKSFIIDREVLVPLFGEGEGHQMVRGHMQMQLLAWHKYMYELGERADFESDRLTANRNLLDRLSVGTIVSALPEHRQIEGLTNVSLEHTSPLGQENALVYKNNTALPRIQLVAKARAIMNMEGTLESLTDQSLDNNIAMVETASLPSDLGQDKSARLTIKKDEPRNIVVATDSNSSQLLVIRDTNYPGWQAQIDGRTIEINTVDTLFRGIFIPAGEHTVIMKYNSPFWKWGATMSALTWLGLIIAGAVTLLCKPNHQSFVKKYD